MSDEKAYPKILHSDVRNLREVAPGLYVGSVYTLNKKGPWDTIIDMIGASKRPEYKSDYFGYRRVLALPMEDGNEVPQMYMKQAITAVKEAQGPTLIHCAMGISRSVSVAYGVLRHLGYGHHEALRRVVDPCGVTPMNKTFASVRAMFT